MRTPLILISHVHGFAWTHYGDFKAYPFNISPFVFTAALPNGSQTEQVWVGGLGRGVDLFGGMNITTSHKDKTNPGIIYWHKFCRAFNLLNLETRSEF